MCCDVFCGIYSSGSTYHMIDTKACRCLAVLFCLKSQHTWRRRTEIDLTVYRRVCSKTGRGHERNDALTKFGRIADILLQSQIYFYRCFFFVAFKSVVFLRVELKTKPDVFCPYLQHDSSMGCLFFVIYKEYTRLRLNEQSCKSYRSIVLCC